MGRASLSESVKPIRRAIPPWRQHSSMCWLARSRRINGMGRKTKDLVHAGILESGPDLVPKLGAWIQRGAQSHDWEVRTKPSSFLMCDYTKHTGNMDESSQNGHILQVQAPPYGLLSESMNLALWFLISGFERILQAWDKHNSNTYWQYTPTSFLSFVTFWM